METTDLLSNVGLKRGLPATLLVVAVAGVCAYVALWTSTFELVGDGFGERCEQNMVGRSGPLEWSWDMTASGVEVSCQERTDGVPMRFAERHLWPFYIWRAVGEAIFVAVAAYLMTSWASDAIGRRLRNKRGPARPLVGGTPAEFPSLSQRVKQYLANKRYTSHLLGLLVATALLTADHLLTMARAQLPYQRDLFVSPFGAPAAAVAGLLVVVIHQRRAASRSGKPPIA